MPGPLAVRVGRLLVWIFVALGAGGGLVSAVRSTPGAARLKANPTEEAPARVTGFAELSVRRWLAGDAQGATSEGPLIATTGRVAGAPLATAATHVVATRRLSARYWAVTVGVETSPGPALWFFETGVLDTADGAVAAGPPAVVPSPLPTGAAVPAGRSLETPAPGDPLAATAQAFLDALLAGRGDVSRYLAPGTRMAAVAPAFESIRVLRMASVARTAGRSIVRVEAVATTAGAELRLGYELTLEQRAGRWEVRGLSGAPTLRPIAGPSPSASPTTSPPAHPTTTAVTPAVPGA